MHIDISIVIPAHAEGRLAYPSLQSAFRATAAAREKGLHCEILVVLDYPSGDTVRFFSAFAERIRIENVSCGDPGLSRNHGVRQATGEYVFFLDADDLFGGGWLSKGYEYLVNAGKDCFVHTEYCVVFDKYSSFWKKKSSHSPDFAIDALIENNCWDIGCGARRVLLLRYPFQATPQTSGFGYEDWHLYCETLADGIDHCVVPETVYFARRKRTGSQLAASNAAGHLLRRSRLFSPEIFHRLF